MTRPSDHVSFSSDFRPSVRHFVSPVACKSRRRFELALPTRPTGERVHQGYRLLSGIDRNRASPLRDSSPTEERLTALHFRSPPRHTYGLFQTRPHGSSAAQPAALEPPGQFRAAPLPLQCWIPPVRAPRQDFHLRSQHPYLAHPLRHSPHGLGLRDDIRGVPSNRAIRQHQHQQQPTPGGATSSHRAGASASHRSHESSCRAPHDRFRNPGSTPRTIAFGDDAIVSAALPPASAAARKETRVGGHGLLLYA